MPPHPPASMPHPASAAHSSATQPAEHLAPPPTPPHSSSSSLPRGFLRLSEVCEDEDEVVYEDEEDRASSDVGEDRLLSEQQQQRQHMGQLDEEVCGWAGVMGGSEGGVGG